MGNQKFKLKFKHFSKRLQVKPCTRVTVLASASRRPVTQELLGGDPRVRQDAARLSGAGCFSLFR